MVITLPFFGQVKESDLVILGGIAAIGVYAFWPRGAGGEEPPPPPPPPDEEPPVQQTPQVLSVELNPNVVGAWAGVIVRVSGGQRYEYTLSLPTSIGDGNHFRNSGATDGAVISEQFYFPPGTHQVTAVVTIPSTGAVYTTIATFDIAQNLNQTFQLLNVHYENF